MAPMISESLPSRFSLRLLRAAEGETRLDNIKVDHEGLSCQPVAELERQMTFISGGLLSGLRAANNFQKEDKKCYCPTLNHGSAKN